MSLESFVSLIRTTDVVRTNRFVFTMAMPRALAVEYNQLPQTLSLMTSAVMMPGMNVTNSTINYGGAAVSVTNGNDFMKEGALPVTFLLDGNMNIRKLFDKWILKQYDPVTGKVGLYDDLTTTARLEILDASFNSIYAWEFYDIKLDQIVALQLTQSKNEVAELSTNFTYKYWAAVDPSIFETGDSSESGPWDMVKGAYQRIKPYLGARFPQLGKIEQTISNSRIGAKVLGDIFKGKL